MMQWLLRWVRPSALTGLTAGLSYVGKVRTEGRISRVYSDLEAVSFETDGIIFEGNARVDLQGHIMTGKHHGKIVSLFRDDTGNQHFFSHKF